LSQISYTPVVDGDQPLAAGFNSRWLLAINLLNSGIESDNISNSAVTTAKIGSKAVTLAKMEDGTQGDILYYGASGVIARLGAGTSGRFLQTQGASANPSWADVPQSVGNAWRNLSVVRTSASQVTVTADELVVRNVSNSGVRITSVNQTITITTSGAGGLDTGSEAANTIYYCWIIRKSSDGTVSGLFSTASAIGSITFPSGYDQAALVSAVGNNNSSDFIDFSQSGSRYSFNTWAIIGSGNVGMGSWSSLDLTPSNMTTFPGFVPSAISNFCYGSFYNENNLFISNDTNSLLDNNPTPNRFGSSGSITYVMGFWQFNVKTSDTIYWASDNSDATVYLHGFEINKLV
jgi:hypothetical protein